MENRFEDALKRERSEVIEERGWMGISVKPKKT